MVSVDDEIDYFQIGQSDAGSHFEYYMNKPEASGYIEFPETYKIIGVDILLDFTLKTIDRSTYSILDFLGDVGGFYGILMLIGNVLLHKLKQFNLDAMI